MKRKTYTWQLNSKSSQIIDLCYCSVAVGDPPHWPLFLHLSTISSTTFIIFFFHFPFSQSEKENVEWKMLGLSVVLEAQKGNNASKKTPQVISKTTVLSSMNKHSPSAVNASQHSPFQEPTFLHQCFLCRKRLLPGKDIYMYKWVVLQCYY